MSAMGRKRALANLLNEGPLTHRDLSKHLVITRSTWAIAPRVATAATNRRFDGLAVQDSFSGCDCLKAGRIRTFPKLVIAMEIPRMQIIVVASKSFLRFI